MLMRSDVCGSLKRLGTQWMSSDKMTFAKSKSATVYDCKPCKYMAIMVSQDACVNEKLEHKHIATHMMVSFLFIVSHHNIVTQALAAMKTLL